MTIVLYFMDHSLTTVQYELQPSLAPTTNETILHYNINPRIDEIASPLQGIPLSYTFFDVTLLSSL